MNTITENLVLKPSRRINERRILKLSQDVNAYNDDFQVLYIDECLNLNEVPKALSCFCFENSPSIFIIAVKVLTCDSLEIEGILHKISLKIHKSCEMILQVSVISSNLTHIFQKKANFDKFICMEFSKDKNFKTSSKNFKFEHFLEIIFHKNISIIDVNFNDILDYLNLKEEFLLLKQAIKAKDEIFVKFLMLFESDLYEDLITDALSTENQSILLTVLSNSSVNEIPEHFKEKILNENFLKVVAEHGNVKVLKMMSKNPQTFSKFIDFYAWSDARKIAIEKSLNEFIFHLQELETEYFSQFQSTEPNSSMSKALKELHKNIARGNLKEVETFIKNYPDFKFCLYDENCALDEALESRKFDIYALLTAQNFLTYNQEKLNKEIQKLSQSDQKKILTENNKLLNVNKDNFIYILATKCEIFSGSTSKHFPEIEKMIRKLSEKREIREVLKNTALADLKIILDFKNGNVFAMNPTCDQHTVGVAYIQEKRIYVAKTESKAQRYGTFVHEMTHLVLFLIYENQSLPYCKNDVKRKNQYRLILKRIQELCKNDPNGVEKIIGRVFVGYDTKYLYRVELIVRINEMLAFYQDNSEKLEELEDLFYDLFDFYRDLILPDLQIPNIFQMITLNNDFGLVKSITENDFQLKSLGNQELLNRITQNGSKKIILRSNVYQLTLQKLYNEIRDLPENKLHLKARNMFVAVDKLQQEQMTNKMIDLLKGDHVERIIVDGSQIKEENLKFFDELSSLCVVIVNKEFSTLLNFTIKEINHEWSELSEESQELLMKKSVNFQNRSLRLLQLLSGEDISSSILSILLEETKIEINLGNVENIKNFIARKIQKVTRIIYQDEKLQPVAKWSIDNFSLDDFVEKAIKDEHVVIISDIAGSGKTTLMKKIYEILLKNYPLYWVSFVALKSHLKELIEGVGDNLVSFMIKIFNLDDLNKEIFTQKFMSGHVIILFDGFDEISPICKEKTLKLFRTFLSSGKNQIIISSRTHLKHDLEVNLNVLGYKIKSLDQEEQKSFFYVNWKEHNKDINPDFIKECANLIVKKITEIAQNIIGLPLIIQSLANVYKDKINENFPVEIKGLKISDVYEKIMNVNFDVLNSKYPENLSKNQKKTISLTQVYHYVAISHLFTEKFATELGLSHDEEQWSSEDVARGGIVKYDEINKNEFHHETYAENLTSTYTMGIFKTAKNASSTQLCLIVTILTRENLQITRMFLDDMLEDIDESKLKIFESSENFCIKIADKVDEILTLAADEGLCNLFIFILHLIRRNSEELYVEVLNSSLYDEILSKIRCVKKFERLLVEVLSNNDVVECFLLDEKCTLFFLTVSYGFKSNLEFLIAKIFELYGENKFKNILNLKAEDGRNFLSLAVANNPYVESIKYLWSVFEGNFDDNKFREILYEVDYQNSNILHLVAISGESVEILEFIFTKIKDFLNDEEKLKEILLLKGGYRKCHPLLSSLHGVNEKTFYFLFDKIYCEVFGVRGFININGIYDENFLHFISRFGSVAMLDFAMKRLKKDLTSDELNVYLHTVNGDNRNLFNLAAESNRIVGSIEFLVDFIEKELCEDELKKMLTTLDLMNRHSLHWSVELNISMVFKALFPIYERKFDENELKDILQIKDNRFNKNVFEIARDEAEFSDNFEAMQESMKKYMPSLVYFTSKFRNLLRNDEEEDVGENGLNDFWVELEEKLHGEEIISFFCEEDEDGDNLLIATIQLVETFEFFESTCIKIMSLIKSKEQLKKFLLLKNSNNINALHFSIIKDEKKFFIFLFEKIFCKTFDLSEFIYETDDDDENFFQVIIQTGSIEALQSATNQLKTMSLQEKKFYLRLKTQNNSNLIHLATLQDADEEFYEILLSFIENEIGNEELKKMLIEVDDDNCLPLHNLVNCGLEHFPYFMCVYEKNFEKKEMKKLLKKKEKNSKKNVIELARDEADDEEEINEIIKKYEIPVLKNYFKKLFRR